MRAGDHVLLLDTAGVSGGKGDDDFAFYRDDRGGSLLWLAILFAVGVVLVAWRRGLMALVSLAVAGVVVIGYLLPALLSGRPPVPVTLASSVLILIVMLFATHGLSMRTAVAVVGALIGLGLSTAFAWFGVIGSRLAGIGDESAELLTSSVSWISVQQLVVASVILAGIGTLNDVTITQVSALWELREASSTLSRLQLFRSAMRIGRDHVASTVYTLVFAYLGTALVLLVAVQLYGGAPANLLTAENVAEEIVRTLVGGIALVLAMPITTAIGALHRHRGRTPRGAPGTGLDRVRPALPADACATGSTQSDRGPVPTASRSPLGRRLRTSRARASIRRRVERARSGRRNTAASPQRGPEGEGWLLPRQLVPARRRVERALAKRGVGRLRNGASRYHESARSRVHLPFAREDGARLQG